MDKKTLVEMLTQRYLEDIDRLEIDKIIERDNKEIDNSAQYISDIMPPQETCVIINIKPSFWNRESVIKSSFDGCYRISRMSYNSLLEQWKFVHDAYGQIEVAFCCHINGIQSNLNNRICNDSYNSMKFYHTFQKSWAKVSKRLGRRILLSKIYCFCPVCQKLYCIGGSKNFYLNNSLFNLIDYTPIGQNIDKEVNMKWKLILEDGKYHHPTEWDNMKRSMFLAKHDVIWYSLHQLTGALYD